MLGDILIYKQLTIDFLDDILNLQNVIYKQMADQSLYATLSREELIESLVDDFAVGVFCDDELVAFSLTVLNRDSSRNLASYQNYKYQEVCTFEAVMVSSKYRGLKIQNQLISKSIEYIKKLKMDIKYISSTVAPNNKHSLNNFMELGFYIANEGLTMYDGLIRVIVTYKI